MTGTSYRIKETKKCISKMYNKLFIPLQHSVEVVYFYIIIWYTFTLSFTEYMETKRTTPERITTLQPGEIFVFGSNLEGMHGGGAAYLAYRQFGAIMGQGVGLQGQSYGIPTMQGGVETIRPYVDEFILFAKAHPELTFLVTRVGCGIAGFTDDEIAPLFEAAHDVENIVLPPNW